MNKPVTLSDIAKKANVSVGTVDRVIHKRGRVSKETENRVKKILQEVDYKPNILARSLSLSRSYRFAVIIPDESHHVRYWNLPVKGIKKAQDELRMYNIHIQYYTFENYSEISFQKNCDSLLKEMSQFDGFLMAPILSKASERFIKRIPNYVPYVLFDSFIPQTTCLTYIGQDAFQSGVQAGKLMELMIKDPGTVAIVRWMPQNYNINRRIEGFRTVLDGRSDVNIIVFDADRGKSTTAFYTTAEQIYEQHSDIRGIFIPSDCASEVASFINNKKFGDHVVVIGYDLTEESIKYLKEGNIDCLISQRPEMQGYQGIYSLFRHIVLKETIEKKCWMPIDIITKENVDYYQN